jgi:hypothetical protein
MMVNELDADEREEILADTVILQAVSEARSATTNNYLKVLKVRRFLLRSHQQPIGKRGVEGFYNDE